MPKVHNPIGSKERLYEMMGRVNKTQITETFDNPEEKDKKYLTKVGDEKSYDKQADKYDGDVRYPVEKPLKVKDDSLQEHRGQTGQETELANAAAEIKNIIKKNFGVDDVSQLSPAQRRDLQTLMGFGDKPQPERSTQGSFGMSDADRETILQRDRSQLDYLVKNMNQIKDLDSYQAVANSYKEKTGEPMMHPMAILAKYGNLDPYTDLRKSLTPLAKILVSHMPNPEKTKKELGMMEGEQLDEISWSGIKQAGKFVGQSIMNKINQIGDGIKSYGDEMARNYQRGARDRVVADLEKLANKFAEDFGKTVDKINDRAVKAGDAPIPVDSIAQSIKNKIVSSYKTGSNVELSKYKTQTEGEELEGGLADGKSPSDFDPEQMEMGVDVEKEHTNDPDIASEIAMDHLSEIPDYYDRLEDMEAEAEAEDDRSADALLYPSSHWTDHYSVKRVGEAWGLNPEAGEDRYEQEQDLNKHLADIENLKFNYDQKGNWIPQGLEDKKVALRKVEQPMGSGNEKVLVVTLDANNDLDDIIATKNSWKEAKSVLLDSIT